MLRSIPIKIKIDGRIKKTIELYKQGLQFCVDTAWGMKIRNNIQLHPFVYPKLKEMGLTAQLSVACIRQACGIVKKKKSNPIIRKVSIRYNKPRSFSFKNNILSISTIEGRVKIPIKIPDYALKYFRDWKIRESLLTQSKDKYYFTFTFLGEDAKTSQHSNRVLGIDLGVNNLAVTSENKVYGGKHIKFLRNKRDRFVADLQRKGTKSSKRKLKKFSGRWSRFMRITNHQISKSIVDGLQAGDVVVMEDLSNIRQTARYNKWVHKWAFRQLQSFIEYKALEIGCRVVYVNPAYTSKECNRCHTRNSVRQSGFFKCNSCGHTINSDINGARNIAGRYILSSRADVNMPIVSSDDSVLSV